MLKSDSAATDLDLISYLKAIPDARMRRGVRIPAWYLLLVAVLGILSRCDGHTAHGSDEPAAAGRFSVNSRRNAGRYARHQGATGDGAATATTKPMMRL